MADSTTSTEFMVDLQALSDAITQVSIQRDNIANEFDIIRQTFSSIEDNWQSPAGDSFVAATTKFNSAATNLLTVLGDAIQRMKTAYQNYASTETTNTQNLE